MFVNHVAVGGTFIFPFVTKNSSGVPINADALPTFRVYGPTAAAGVMANGTGTAAFRHTGTITNVISGGGLCRCTCVAHGLQTGQRVTVSGVNGATGANTTAVVTRIDADTFDLVGTTFGGAYTNGGTFNVTGLYYASVSVSSGDGYEAGKAYSVIADYAISSSAQTREGTFQAV